MSSPKLALLLCCSTLILARFAFGQRKCRSDDVCGFGSYCKEEGLIFEQRAACQPAFCKPYAECGLCHLCEQVPQPSGRLAYMCVFKAPSKEPSGVNHLCWLRANNKI